jgi:hypothetical protein
MSIDPECAVALSAPDGRTRDVWVLSESELAPHISLWRPTIFDISHKTHYRYRSMVVPSLHLLHMSPRTLPGQIVRHYSLTVEPTPASRQDGIGVRYRVDELLKGSREAILVHRGQQYRLRITASGKLILTK